MSYQVPARVVLAEAVQVGDTILDSESNPRAVRSIRNIGDTAEGTSYLRFAFSIGTDAEATARVYESNKPVLRCTRLVSE